MTSVQNRLQLLSGNNLLVFLLLIASISSCSSKKITSTKKVEVVEIQKKPSAAELSAKKRYEDSISKKPVIFDNSSNKNNSTNTNTNTYTKNKDNLLNNDPNRIHNIAVILPFNLNQIPLGQYADDSTKQLSIDSKAAVEFYLGCQMAREKFESENLKANVYFLDDDNDSTATTNLFNLKPFPNVDYIVGPLYNKNLRAAVELAKNNQIPIIFPLYNSLSINNNPYYFNAFPSLKTQYGFILEQTKTKYPSKTLEVIYDGKDSSAENIDILKSIADKYYTFSKIKYTSIQAWNDAAKMLYQEDTLSERIILIYSSKDSYVKSIIAKLKPLKNHLHIYTSSCIKNTKALADLKNTNSIYTAYPFNTGNPNYSVFEPKFEEKYKNKPSEISSQGFDIMMHLFYLLDKNQSLQDNIYNYSADFDNIQTKFQFKPIVNKNGDVQYYDNTFLYLYKYVNGTFIIATP